MYRLLLILYPDEHRREYGEQMVQLFGDRLRRDGGGFRTAIVWLHILSDLLRSALIEHVERGGYWGIIKALLFFSTRFTARKAQTNREVAASLLLPVLATTTALGVALIVSSYITEAERYREAFLRTGAIMLPTAAFVNPLLTGMTFRLRHRYDLRSVLLAIAIYWPIHAFANTTVFHSFIFLFQDETPAFAISGVSLFFGSIMAIFLCILPVLMCLSGSSRVPAPTFVAHPYFQRAEIGLFGIALLGLGTTLLMIE